MVTAFVYWKMSSPLDAYWMMPLMGAAQLSVFGGFSIYLPEASVSLMYLRRSSKILIRAQEAVVDKERAAVSINSARAFGSRFRLQQARHHGDGPVPVLGLGSELLP